MCFHEIFRQKTKLPSKIDSWLHGRLFITQRYLGEARPKMDLENRKIFVAKLSKGKVTYVGKHLTLRGGSDFEGVGGI